MTMALAVALVACQGAAGTPGPAGPPGPPGEPAPTTPTTPADPTTPTTPTGPTGAAPVAKAIPPVFLALEGTGAALSKAIGLDAFITDADSQIKYSASSSDATVATATLPVNGRTVTIAAKKVGTATITVTARDGDNDPLTAPISVTVVRSNDRPTTNDLSKADIDELEETLYVADGDRTDTVTVKASAGSTSSETLSDSIVDFKKVVGKDDDGKDDLVSVTVIKVTGTTHQYDIKLTPKSTSLDKGPQDVKIYPMDMFGAISSEAWEFKAMFNKTPKRLVDSFGTIRLTRTATTAVTDERNTIGTINIVVPGAAPNSGNAILITISDYFDLSTLDRMTIANNSVPGDTNANTIADSEVDMVGDTVCDVAVSTGLAVMQRLNERGEAARYDDAGALDTDGEIASNDRVTSTQALAAIVIDSRVSNFGGNGVVGPALIWPGFVAHPHDDTPATGEGSFPVTIRCTDKDATAEVTGTVVVQDA